MSNINNQTKSLNNIAEVQSVDNETAANIQGGWDLLVYDNNTGSGQPIGKFNHGTSVIGAANNNKIGSVRINAGRWKFSDLYHGFGKNIKVTAHRNSA